MSIGGAARRSRRSASALVTVISTVMLVFVVLLAHAPLARCAETEERIDAVVSSQRRGALRVTFGLRTAPDDYDFEDPHYVQGIVMLAMVGVVIGTVFLLCGMCSCVSRCASKSPKSPNIYTSGQRLWPKIAVFPVAIAVVLGAGLSYKGNSEFDPELRAFLTTLVDNSVERAALSRTLVDTMNTLDTTPSGRKLVLMRLLMLQADEDVVFVRDSEADLLSLNGSRESAMQLAVILSFTVCGLGLLLVLVRNKWVGYLMAALGFLTLFAMWLSFGFHYAGSVLVADICNEIKDFNVNTTDVTTGTASADGGTGGSFNDPAPGGVIVVVPEEGSSGVTADDATTSDATLVTPFTRCLSTITVNNVVVLAARGADEALANLTTAITSSGGADPDFAPASQANRESLRAQSEPYRPSHGTLVTRAHGWLDMMQEFGKLATCDYVRSAFKEVRSEFCVSWIMSLRLITAGNGIAAVVLILGAWLGLLGADRFPNPTIRKRKPKPPPKVKHRKRTKYGKTGGKTRASAALAVGAGAGAAAGVAAVADNDDDRDYYDQTPQPHVDALPALMTGPVEELAYDEELGEEEDPGGYA